MALALSACATPDPAPPPLAQPAHPGLPAPNGDNVTRRLALERYVRTVFTRIATANADLCQGHLMAEFGMRFATLESVGDALRPEAAASGVLSDVPLVFFTGPGLPADRAGIEVGDLLVGIEGRRLAPGEPAKGQFSQTLSDAFRARGTVRFLMERGGEEFEADVTPVPSCAANVFLDTKQLPNAFTDGEDVLILAGMLGVARTPSELAVVIGHELGHVIEEQRLGPGRRESDPMAAEMEADRIGLYLAARAGYDISGATIVMERIVAWFPEAARGGESHPSSLLRIEAMKATEREIAGRQQRGEPLWPYGPDA